MDPGGTGCSSSFAPGAPGETSTGGNEQVRSFPLVDVPAGEQVPVGGDPAEVGEARPSPPLPHPGPGSGKTFAAENAPVGIGGRNGPGSALDLAPEPGHPGTVAALGVRIAGDPDGDHVVPRFQQVADLQQVDVAGAGALVGPGARSRQTAVDEDLVTGVGRNEQHRLAAGLGLKIEVVPHQAGGIAPVLKPAEKYPFPDDLFG